MGLEGGTIRWGISIPQFAVDGTFEPAALRSYLGRAEALGFESAWTLEQVMGTRPHLAPIGRTRNRLIGRMMARRSQGGPFVVLIRRVVPEPVLTRFEGLHQRMAAGARMLAGVLRGR